MRQYESKSGQVSVKSDPSVGEKVVAFLKAIHPSKTSEGVAADTGISPAVVDKWILRYSVPGGLAILRLMAAYGPEFWLAIDPKAPRWLRETHRRHRIKKLTEQQEAIERELEELK